MPDVQMREALELARDFLRGLVDTTGMRGYYDPQAGEVSVHFVLGMITQTLKHYEASPAHIDGDNV